MSKTVSGLEKPKRENVNKILAVNMKPAELRETDEGLRTLVTFVEANGDSRTLDCTKEVYRRVEGNPRPGKAHYPMDMLLDKNFLISVDKQTNKVVGVDVMPKVLTNRFGKLADQDTIEFVSMRINQDTGDIDIKSVPPKVGAKDLIRIINSLDNEELITTGQRLAGRYEVMSVSGNSVEIDTAV